jgi:hypothetical protein
MLRSTLCSSIAIKSGNLDIPYRSATLPADWLTIYKSGGCYEHDEEEAQDHVRDNDR